MFGKKKNNENEISIKEAAKNLEISEATVKKYLRDFKLDEGKNKSSIDQNTYIHLTEIAKLRSNGMSIQEIKDLIAQRPTTEPVQEEKTKEVEAVEPEFNFDIADLKNVESNLEKVILEKDVEDTVTKDIVSSDASGESEIKDIEEESDIPSEEVVETEDGVRKRRLFNYRYVERQISNDSKRISTLRQRLKNPNLPIQDRLFFEEALERRILFLDGWKHILRWVSSGNRSRYQQDAQSSSVSEEKETENTSI